MTQTPPPVGTGARLTFNAPLGQDAVDRLLTQVVGEATRTIADLGCGWGELLLDALERAPEATGVGYDIHEPDIVRAGALAQQRGLSDRVAFHAEDAKRYQERADLVLSIGAYQAFGDIPTALAWLRERLAPGGRMLFGCEYWARRPTAEQLATAWGGIDESECRYLPEVADAVHAAGWRILDMHDSTRGELDAFELGYLRDRQEWALEHPGHPVGAEVEAALMAWLRGHREPFGFVTLVLG